jgi:hypothetical protein
MARVNPRLLPLPFDLDEGVARVRLCADDLPGRADAPFDFAVRAIDAAEDYPESEAFQGHDDAPDNLATGGRLAYDPAPAGCLGAAAAGEAAPDLAGTIDLAPGSTKDVAIALRDPGCGPPGGTVVVTAPSNAPVRRPLWRLGVAASAPIYLPALATK